jgi:heptosyltransferase-2
LERIKPYQLGRIVVRSPTWVGDAVMSIPALRELRRLLPGSHITVAAPPGTIEIFAEANFIDDLLTVESGFFPALRQLRRGKFDLALLFQNAFAAASLAYAARIPFRIGYGTDRRGFLLTRALTVPSWKDEKHECFYYLNIISEFERLIVHSLPFGEGEPLFDLTVSPKRKEDPRQFLAGKGADSDKPIVILCPGSVNSRAKRWPAARYAELADQFRNWGANVALIGSAAEGQVLAEVSAHAEHQPITLTGETTVAEMVALISIADALVTNDTGPAHIGAATGTPTLVIFGPTNPLTTYPMSPSAEMIREPPDCAPCMLRDCPIDHRCMTAISVESVFQRTIAMMSRNGAQLSG